MIVFNKKSCKKKKKTLDNQYSLFKKTLDYNTLLSNNGMSGNDVILIFRNQKPCSSVLKLKKLTLSFKKYCFYCSILNLIGSVFKLFFFSFSYFVSLVQSIRHHKWESIYGTYNVRIRSAMYWILFNFKRKVEKLRSR